MPFRTLLAAGVLLASGPVFAAADPAAQPVADPTAAAAAPTEIEIVHGGGVAEVWRREGSDFAAYGPEGEAVVPTPERQALQALANAYDVVFVALAPASPESAGVAPCGAGGCVGGHAAVARVPVGNVAQYRLAQRIGDGWLRRPAPVPASCEPGYGHGLSYSSEGHAWEVLLDYGCGRYLLRRDGVEIATGHAAEPPAKPEFDALLATGGTGDP